MMCRGPMRELYPYLLSRVICFLTVLPIRCRRAQGGWLCVVEPCPPCCVLSCLAACQPLSCALQFSPCERVHALTRKKERRKTVSLLNSALVPCCARVARADPCIFGAAGAAAAIMLAVAAGSPVAVQRHPALDRILPHCFERPPTASKSVPGVWGWPFVFFPLASGLQTNQAGGRGVHAVPCSVPPFL